MQNIKPFHHTILHKKICFVLHTLVYYFLYKPMSNSETLYGPLGQLQTVFFFKEMVLFFFVLPFLPLSTEL